MKVSGNVELQEFHDASFASLNSALQGAAAGRFISFFNMGYRDVDGDDGGRRCIDLGGGFNSDAARLYSELIGSTDLSGCRVLEVGCGRAGGAEAVASRFEAARVFGLDRAFSSLAARIDRAAVARLNGDSQALCVRTGALDVVVNLESSQFYPRPGDFFREVSRVLKSGGRFLYGDCLRAELLSTYLGVAGASGLELLESRDISQNVLASRRAVGGRQVDAFSGLLDRRALEEFIVAEGSENFRRLESGEYVYVLAHFKRGEPSLSAQWNEDDLNRAAELLAGFTAGMHS